MAAAYPEWSWQETQALLARLSQISAAALRKEYDNCQRLTAFLNSDPLTTQFDQLTASQLSSTLLRWCTLAQPILQVVINQADQLTKFPAAFSAVGVLLNTLGMCLESWVRQTAQQQQQALKQQIAEQTSDGMLLPQVPRHALVIAPGPSPMPMTLPVSPLQAITTSRTNEMAAQAAAAAGLSVASSSSIVVSAAMHDWPSTVAPCGIEQLLAPAALTNTVVADLETVSQSSMLQAVGPVLHAAANLSGAVPIVGAAVAAALCFIKDIIEMTMRTKHNKARAQSLAARAHIATLALHSMVTATQVNALRRMSKQQLQPLAAAVVRLQQALQAALKLAHKWTAGEGAVQAVARAVKHKQEHKELQQANNAINEASIDLTLQLTAAGLQLQVLLHDDLKQQLHTYFCALVARLEAADTGKQPA